MSKNMDVKDEKFREDLIVDRYLSIVTQIKELTILKTLLRQQIIRSMKENNQTSFDGDKGIASLSSRTKVAYNNEILTNILSSKGIPIDRFVKHTPDMDKVEQLVATGEVSVADISHAASIKEIDTLLIKER